MTRVPLLCVLLASAAVSARAGEAPIRLPVGPVVPQPMPGPDAAVRLAADQLYVVDGDVPFLIFASPKGLVSVTREEGPLKLRGKFVGGTGRTETRTFKGKHLAVVEAVGTGRVELLVVPEGAKSEADAITRTLDVDAGEGPRPPPKPPEPPPEPAAPIPAAGLHVLIVEESAGRSKLPEAQLQILFSKSVRDYLNATCPPGPDGKTRQWRIWDADVDGYADSKLWGDAMKRPRTSTPWLVVSNGKAGYEGPLPATVADALALLKKYGG